MNGLKERVRYSDHWGDHPRSRGEMDLEGMGWSAREWGKNLSDSSEVEGNGRGDSPNEEADVFIRLTDVL